MLTVVIQSLFAGLMFGLVAAAVVVPPLYLTGNAIVVGLYGAVACGVAFGAAIGVFAVMAHKHFRSRLPLGQGEFLVHQGPANHFVAGEAVGGWLYLTNHRLVFASHRLNKFVHRWQAPVTAILGSSYCFIHRVVPNGIRILSTEGERRFAVSGRRQWQRHLASCATHLPNPSSCAEAQAAPDFER